MYSKEYLKFAKYMGTLKAEHEPYTRSKRKFAEYLIKNKKNLQVIGNMEQVFVDVRNYFRSTR